MVDKHDKSLIDRHVRLDPRLYKKAVENAEKANMSFNQYLNVLISKGKITYKYSDEEAEEINKAITYLHRNVNQLNIQINQLLRNKNLLPSTSFEILKEVQQLKQATNEVGDFYVDKKRRKKRS